MDLTDEEKEVLKRVLERLLIPTTVPKGLTVREARELRRKAQEDAETKQKE